MIHRFSRFKGYVVQSTKSDHGPEVDLLTIDIMTCFNIYGTNQ